MKLDFITKCLRSLTLQCLDGHFTRFLFQVLGHALVQHRKLSLGQHVQRLDVLARELPLGVDANRGRHGTEGGRRQLGDIVDRDGSVCVGDSRLRMLLASNLILFTPPSLLVRVNLPSVKINKKN